MRILYDILFAIGFILTSPYYFIRMQARGNWRFGFFERFGIYDHTVKSLAKRHVIWIHAVSVGEVNLAIQLVRVLEERLPNVRIVTSSTTTTGMAELRRRLSPRIVKIYYPIDWGFVVKRALRAINPEAIVLIETEVWPNFVWNAKDMGIPIFIANARVSDRSLRGYTRYAFIFKSIFESLLCIGAQTETDAVRLRQIGCRPEAVKVLGNMKFDAAKLDKPNTADVAALLRRINVPLDEPVLVCGSTARGEDILLAEIARRLRARFPKLFLILVPRHVERCKEVGRELRARGITFIYRNEINEKTQYATNEVKCLLVNTTGELRAFYEQATIAFVGKSLTSNGGQNPIEPAAMGKAVVFGPNMENFSDIAQNFLSQHAAVQVSSSEELEVTLGSLLASEERRKELGRNAQRVTQENLGATERTVGMILENLDGFGVYIAPKP